WHPPLQRPPPAHANKPSFAISVNAYLSDWNRLFAKADVEAQRRPRMSFSSIRYLILTIYRRLLSLVYCANSIAFIVVMIRSQHKLLAFINAAGINVCGLARHPLVVNAIFRSTCCISQSAPFGLRKRAAESYQYGEVHSGCGYTGGLVALVSKEYWLNEDSGAITVPVIILSYALLVHVITLIAVKIHNYLELIHPFGGWLAVEPYCWSSQIKLDIRKAYLSGNTCSGFQRFDLSWSSLCPSSIRGSSPPGASFTRASHRMISDSRSHIYCIPLQLSPIPMAGDWTTRCIEQKPTHLWRCGVLMYGFIHIMRVFCRVVVVAMGSRIRPCLSFLGEKNRPQLQLIWQTWNRNRTYGPDILSLVNQLCLNPPVVDTGSSGQVDIVPIFQELVREIDTEAVCVISNPRLTKRVVFELKARGVLAFGPIFDS
ncbi:Integral membrane protein TmpA, partial [Penicillium expansum]